MSNKLKAITAKAKQLYKSGRYSKWTDAIKAASKQVAKPAKKKVSGLRAQAQKKLIDSVKRASKHTDKKSHNVKIHVVSGAKAHDLEHVRFRILKSLERIDIEEKIWKQSDLSKSVLSNKLKHLKNERARLKKMLTDVNRVINSRL